MPNVTDVVAAAKAAGISILGITDHNSISGVEAALSLADKGLLIVPGVEITAADSDILALFSPANVDGLKDLMRPDVVKLTEIGGGALRSSRSTADLIQEIGQRGGIALLAHVDVADGFLAKATNAAKSDVLKQRHLAGIEITNLANIDAFTSRDPVPLHVQLQSERTKLLGWRAGLARIMSSDAHSPEQVGLDSTTRTITRLRLDQLDFDGLRAALLIHPSSRCRLEAELSVHYPRLLSARFEGGFLDGLKLDFSANLNCLIGGRGSGKSTALLAIGAVLTGWADHAIDEQANMPDYTEVSFVDGLGTNRKAGRKRYENSFDVASPSAPLALDYLELEQNYGSELQVDDDSRREATLDFLGEFLPPNETQVDETRILAELADNGDVLRRTAGAGGRLLKLKLEKTRLTNLLTTATDAKLQLVAEYAAVLASEGPLLSELLRQIDDLPKVAIPRAPDVVALARDYAVDLAHEPASKFVPGPTGLEGIFESLSRAIELKEKGNQSDLETLVQPARDLIGRWSKQHAKWEGSIKLKTDQLKAGGLSLQVAELDKMRRDLATVDADIRTNEEAQRAYTEAVSGRVRLVESLRDVRDRRFKARKRATKSVMARINAASAAVEVAVTWNRAGNRDLYAELLGQLFELRTPRKERLASAISPNGLAAMAWANDAAGIEGIKAGAETFFLDGAAALSVLRKFDTLFELETMALPDTATIRVRFPDDPAGLLRELQDLSLGQLRSVLLGFLLHSPGNHPLLLDQPEDQLDGPFVAGVVVPYLHSVKEERQLLVATHNANVVVLGDAEQVLPLHANAGKASVVNPGSVDASDTRDELLNLLEGGIEAFERRAARYGLIA